MADLNPLIRYQKHQLDEKQKFLGRLYAEANKLLEDRKAVIEQIQKEKEAITIDEDVQDVSALMTLGGFENFLHKAKAQIAEIENQEKLLDTRIDIAINDMRESFGELKKIEIIQRQRLEEERKKLEAKEAAIFEEIGLNIFRNNQE